MTDRELDAMVAERVMGWRRVGANWYTKSSVDDVSPPTVIPGHDEADYKGAHDWFLPPDCDGSWPDREKHGVSLCGCRSRGAVPSFSTSIADAWLVVEAMERKGYCWTVESEPAACIRAEFAPEECGPLGRRGASEEDSAPRAICLAAMRALDVEVAK